MRIQNDLALVASLQFGLAGPLDCSVYALRGREGVVLIDSGAGLQTERLLTNLRDDLGDDSVLAAVVLTHCHADHAGGAAALKERTGCHVYAPALSRKIIEAGDEQGSGLALARELGVYPRDYRLRACPIDAAFEDGVPISIAGIELTPIHVRGHSHDAFCLFDSQRRRLFSGDVVFYGGVLGLINAEGSEMAGYRADLGKLAGLAVEGLFPGHGLFTVAGGQRHIDCAIEQLRKGSISRQIGQGDLIF